jgi:hypothetical protein
MIHWLFNRLYQLKKLLRDGYGCWISRDMGSSSYGLFLGSVLEFAHRDSRMRIFHYCQQSD